MDALGQIIVYLFFYGIAIILILLVCVIGIIYYLVKSPKKSTRLLLSFLCGALIVTLIVLLTQSLWLDIGDKPESSIIGLFASLCVVLIITYGLNNYFSNKEK